MPVIDASAALYLLASADGLDPLADVDLMAPALMWSEVTSVLSEMRSRQEISDELADTSFDRLLVARIARRANGELYRSARVLARQLGWAKTYDAEYVALARTARTALITRDERLRRRVRDLVEVVSPDEVVPL